MTTISRAARWAPMKTERNMPTTAKSYLLRTWCVGNRQEARWQPDVIVCQGWASAVVPFYVKTAYSEEPSFAESKVITALYTNELKG